MQEINLAVPHIFVFMCCCHFVHPRTMRCIAAGSADTSKAVVLILIIAALQINQICSVTFLQITFCLPSPPLFFICVPIQCCQAVSSVICVDSNSINFMFNGLFKQIEELTCSVLTEAALDSLARGYHLVNS